ncbi:MAG: hypothetical protein WBM39_05075 [Parasphingorhabdus sp.]
MKVFGGNPREIKLANSNDRTKLAIKGRSERTKATLRHTRAIYQIKADGLGDHYKSLGDLMWQILCDIYLRNIDGIDFSVSDLEQSLDLSGRLAKRYIAVLESEALLEATGNDGGSRYRNLLLTELGCSKVQSILDQCTDAFTEGFVYSSPRLVKTES